MCWYVNFQINLFTSNAGRNVKKNLIAKNSTHVTQKKKKKLNVVAVR